MSGGTGIGFIDDLLFGGNRTAQAQNQAHHVNQTQGAAAGNTLGK